MQQRFGWMMAVAVLATLLPASAAFAAGGVSGADVQVSGSASTGSPNPGAAFTYTFQIKNSGPDTASGIAFTGQLPAGVEYRAAALNGSPITCSTSNDASGGTNVACAIGTILKGGQLSLVVNVVAPTTAGTYSTVGAASSSVTDPQPANNSVTLNVQVKTATCALPAGQTTLSGMVMAKYTDSSGLFEDFAFQANGVNYTVITNFYDGAAPLTTVINLLCKQSPVQFVQVGNIVSVTGTIGSAAVLGPDPTPVINASVVQVPYFIDKI